MPGGFTFNQILIAAEAPLLFHTGQRKLFPLVKQAVEHVLGDVTRLRYVSFSHVEADECGSLNQWLAVAPQAEAVCGKLAAILTVNDMADRAPKTLADGERLSLGSHEVRWLDAPHVPHNWECGFMFESSTRTLLCGDLLTHSGHDLPPLTESDVVGPAEVGNKTFGHMSGGPGSRAILEKLASTEPTTLALMHGSSFRGDGRRQLLGLADVLGV
jgi:flavorubredoxin